MTNTNKVIIVFHHVTIVATIIPNGQGEVVQTIGNGIPMSTFNVLYGVGMFA